MELVRGLEPPTCWLQVSCSANWATSAYCWLIRQPPTFPGSLPPSIIGRLGLNRRVRYGNGCVPQAYRHRKCYTSFCLYSQNRIIKVYLSRSIRFSLTLKQITPLNVNFLRKEVIQPHLPIRLPCYDFTPVTGFTFGCSSLAVRSQTSGASNSHGVTGGVYKTRERIHRDILIRDY